jgi:uncharacterized protein YndB with AHSA1/START domain
LAIAVESSALAPANRKEIAMPDILHRVGINAPLGKVFDALATCEGLRNWWTAEAKGEAGAGGTIDFGFCRMQVVEAKPGTIVHWRCATGPDEWIGTEVLFRLEWKENQTFILFKHSNWKEPNEFMHHCSTKWATFLLSLRDLLETGKGRPAPHDLKIHVGD